MNAYPRPADLAEIKADPTLKVVSASGLNIAFWAFNVNKPPLNKKEVRQALSMSIDRDAILKDVYLGAGEKAKTLIPRTMWSYNDAIADYPYDPAKAQAMLKAAGVDKLDIDLWYQPVQRPYNPNGKRIGEMMQADNGAPSSAGFPADAGRMATLMRQEPSLKLGFFALGGWDTHVNQGGADGQLAQRLKPLGDGLVALARDRGQPTSAVAVASRSARLQHGRPLAAHVLHRAALDGVGGGVGAEPPK